MRVRMAFAALLAGLLVRAADGQEPDAALRDRVAQLVERLDDPKAEAGEAAEKALIKLGGRALSLLPEKPAGDRRKERLDRVRKAIEAADEPANLGASKVTIQGQAIRLSDVVRQIQAQTGNPITDLREQFGQEVTNPSFDLDFNDLNFFEALDRVASQGDVAVNFFTGDGSVGLTGGPMEPAPKDAAPMVAYTGPFRVAFKQMVVQRDFLTGKGSANAQFEVAWEPRIRPMLLALKAEDIKIVDDHGQEVAPAVMGESTDVPLRPENPAAEINLNMAAPDRKAQKLASLKVKAAVTVPAALRTFRFPSLADKGVKREQGDLAVTLEDVEVDEQVWKVHVTVAYPGGGPAFESYRQGLFNNRLWLQRKDGSRFEHNGGFSNTASDQGKLGFEYLFVEAPGKPADYQFVYETPSKVITIPLEFEFKDVPLP